MKKLIVSTAVVLSLTGGAIALWPSKPTKADEKSPLVTQVDNHEQRIGDLETKTDDTQTQVNQNTADISAVQSNTNTPSAPKVERVYTSTAQPAQNTSTTQPMQSTPEPTPQPEPAKNPMTITSVSSTPYYEMKTCSYTVLRDSYNYISHQSNDTPCLKVGDILPRELY